MKYTNGGTVPVTAPGTELPKGTRLQNVPAKDPNNTPGSLLDVSDENAQLPATPYSKWDDLSASYWDNDWARYNKRACMTDENRIIVPYSQDIVELTADIVNKYRDKEYVNKVVSENIKKQVDRLLITKDGHTSATRMIEELTPTLGKFGYSVEKAILPMFKPGVTLVTIKDSNGGLVTTIDPGEVETDDVLRAFINAANTIPQQEN